MQTLHITARKPLARLLFVSVSLLLTLLFTACGGQVPTNQAAAHINTTQSNTAVVIQTQPMPATQTSCPAAGQARPAVTAPLALGKDQNIVYVDQSAAQSSLLRYDVVTAQKTTILSIAKGAITNAQLSTDGQFILFLSGLKIQMIRLDGLGLQTLYCSAQSNGIPTTPSNLFWSPNQQLAAFEEPSPYGGPSGPVVRLLDLQHGTVQSELDSGMHSSIQLTAWHGNTQVYYTILTPPMTLPLNNVYVLSVPTASEQRTNGTVAASISGFHWDMSLTPDSNTLVLAQSGDFPNYNQGASALPDQLLPPSLITTQDAHGGTLHVVYASHVHAVSSVEAIGNNTLLFTIADVPYAPGPADGLWKIQFDGTGLIHLAQGYVTLPQSSTAWTSVSRDNALYAATQTTGVGTASTTIQAFYGSLNGGTPKQFATTAAGETLTIVGWSAL